MARPINSTKPLYANPIVKAGRPASAKLTVGYLGPGAKQLTDDHVAQAVVLGQAIAEQRHIATILIEEGINTAFIRGIRSKAGTVIGFTDLKNKQNLLDNIQLPPLDTVIYAAQSSTQQKQFLESLDILIIHAYNLPQIQLTQPLPRTIPVGVLINSRESVKQVAYIAGLAEDSKSPIDYADNPRQLVVNLIKQVKKMPNND